MDAAFVKVGSLLACAEMILSGTTTFCDMYLFAQEVAMAAKESGMRCVNLASIMLRGLRCTDLKHSPGYSTTWVSTLSVRNLSRST